MSKPKHVYIVERYDYLPTGEIANNVRLVFGGADKAVESTGVAGKGRIYHLRSLRARGIAFVRHDNNMRVSRISKEVVY